MLTQAAGLDRGRPRQVKITSVTEVAGLKKTKGTHELSTVCYSFRRRANPFANCYPILSLSLSLSDSFAQPEYA